ncbi:MAG: hypothetical protein ACP5LP_00470 [Candidatus Micrarchaeia archaeon]
MHKDQSKSSKNANLSFYSYFVYAIFVVVAFIIVFLAFAYIHSAYEPSNISYVKLLRINGSTAVACPMLPATPNKTEVMSVIYKAEENPNACIIAELNSFNSNNYLSKFNITYKEMNGTYLIKLSNSTIILVYGANSSSSTYS